MTPEERDEILARIDEIQKFIAMTVEEKKEYIAEMNRLGKNPSHCKVLMEERRAEDKRILEAIRAVKCDGSCITACKCTWKIEH